jgi:PAS domain S-box-containing protein
MALLLLATVVATYLMGAAVLHSSQILIRQHAVISSLNQTLSTLKDAETGQRGYLLAGEASYLDPYHLALDRIHAQIGVLSDEAKAGELPAGDVNSLITLVNQKLAELRYTVDLTSQGHREAAVAHLREGHGKLVMEDIRDRISTMLNVEERQLASDLAAADRVTTARTVLFIIVGFLNLGFLYWSFLRVREEMKGREIATAEIVRQKDLLAVTLASIGDAVIVTDAAGNITFLNEVAEKLTGWSSKEAAGLPCSKVFHIISEQTRNSVESPVEKVLRLGVVVGLANHTLLIRRDGSEVPIDDSGAPIREVGGEVRGVVLVFRDFTEHKSNERTLRAAKEELEAASKAKDHFLATLSHELRTPLTPVLATLTTWEASDELPEAFREDVQMLRRNIALEARLIDDLLDLTRIVRGKLVLETEVVDIHELLRSVAGMYRSEIHSREVVLSLALNATRPYANVDPGRIQQVFWNILKNAAKFTQPGGKIEISTANAPNGTLQITFRDSGIGMSPEMLDRLFQPFAQGAEEVVRRAGGLGLGMAISKALLDIQSGGIAASSEGSGKGSIFTVTLPTVPAPTGPPSGDANRDPKQRPHARLLNILLVEDHADTARVMGRLLRRLGHTVETSDTVATALAMVSAGNYDILLSDIGLPDGTGLDLMRQIRITRNIPAVALTGFGMEDDIAKCREAGFIAHLTKPVNFQRLEMVIQQVATAKGG